VAGRLPGCRFGIRVEELRWLEGAGEPRGSGPVDRDGPGLFEATLTEVATGRTSRRRARNLVLGVGTTPAVPDALAGALGKDVFHAAEFLDRRERLRQAAAVVVVGSGQSGAEVFLDLLREQPGSGYRLDWLTRSSGFFPMEYSRLGLEHFTPDYTRYFHDLPAATRDRLLPTQDLLYKGIDAGTIAEIGDLLYERTVAGAEPGVRLLAHAEVRSLEAAGGRWRLTGRQWEQGRDFGLDADCVVLATGYRAAPPACLAGLAGLVDWDEAGRYRVGLDYRVATDPRVTGGLYVQNGELHSHGVGTPDLGLGAHRAATIVNALTGREVYRLPRRTAFTDFGVD
jgi:lysine N6-hydroxylase